MEGKKELSGRAGACESECRERDDAAQKHNQGTGLRRVDDEFLNLTGKSEIARVGENGKVACVDAGVVSGGLTKPVGHVAVARRFRARIHDVPQRVLQADEIVGMRSELRGEPRRFLISDRGVGENRRTGNSAVAGVGESVGSGESVAKVGDVGGPLLTDVDIILNVIAEKYDRLAVGGASVRANVIDSIIGAID